MIPKEFINAIQSKIDSLDDGDVKGVLMWSEFKEFSENWKPKGKTIEERKDAFYKEVAEYKSVYSGAMLREFYDYWTESDGKTKLLPFEKAKKKRAFNVKLRLGTWFRNSNQSKEASSEQFKPNDKTYNR